MNSEPGIQASFAPFEEKMRGAGLKPAFIKAFEHSFSKMAAGESGFIPEHAIQPVVDLRRFESLPPVPDAGSKFVAQTVVIKLNGGLGTSMGLERAKSLLPVKNGLTFLDLIARQLLHLRQQHGNGLRFLLMNSFSTSADTRKFLEGYPELGDPAALELLQSQVPKVDARTLAPVAWPENPTLEWCPPGHGDIYPSLFGSGKLEELLKAGVRYAFVSNSDNLGATLDLAILQYFAESGQPFLMEVAERTESDRKGGHLACRNGRFLLRESAQCPKEDTDAFQDIQRHHFFNTNNLWLRLDALAQLLESTGGFIPLPLIKNGKTVDPRKKDSPPVFQLETAMGAAIECFADSGALVVPRTRFAPVKTTSDLLVLRSDAYQIAEDSRVVPAFAPEQGPPTVELDSAHYKLVDQLDAKLAQGVPSLKECRKLSVAGPVAFSNAVVFRGNVEVTNPGNSLRAVPPGVYADRSVSL